MKEDNKEKKEKKSFKEIWTNPRYKALIKLGGYFVFIIFALIYVGITSSLSGGNYNNVNKQEKNRTLAEFLGDNYSYNYSVIVTNEDNEEKYYYSGIYNSGNEKIVISYNNEDNEYLKESNNYYKKIDGNYILSDETNVYKNNDLDYLNISLLSKYLEKAVMMETGKYKLFLNKIILNYEFDDYILIEYAKNNDEINLDIDYTNLAKISNNNISNYYVKMVFNQNNDNL